MADEPTPARKMTPAERVAAIDARYRGHWDELDLSDGSVGRSQLAFDVGYLVGLAEQLLAIVPLELLR